MRQSSTQINGHISVRFAITRGVRQGCPLSAILYSLLTETLGEEIRNSKKLFRIVLPGNQEIKITQYADDTTIYLSEKTQLKHLCEILKCFELATGSKVNEGKTNGIRIGNSKHIDEWGGNFPLLAKLRIGRLPTLENTNRGRDTNKLC